MNIFHFCGVDAGQWRIASLKPVKGISLPEAPCLDVIPGDANPGAPKPAWVLRGFTSNVRYGTRAEVATLRAKQEGLGRSESTCAALIPIRKSAAWWELAQDERRAIFEESSRHTSIGVEYLPAIARRLYHCRDIGEPFDFLTWFEYSPEHSADFERLVDRLRSTNEWAFVEREIDIRLERS